MKNKFSILFLGVLSLLMLFFGFKSYHHAKTCETYSFEIAGYKNAETLAEQRAKGLLEELTFGLYQNKEEISLSELETLRAFHHRVANEYLIVAIVTLLVILSSYFFVPLHLFTLFGGLSALVMLGVGLNAPIMMVTIHKEVEYLGDVILSFESKSVFGSILKLWENSEFVIALVILLFSVIVPLFKTVTLLFVTLFNTNRFAHGVVKFFKMVGKWSMLDVFVVAVFLVYLTSNSSDVSRAEAQVGLYFFLAYVIVSMLTSLSVDKMLDKIKT